MVDDRHVGNVGVPMEKRWKNVGERIVDVVKSIENYRKSHPYADRASLRTMIRQDYEIDRLTRGTGTNDRETFLRSLDRNLEKEFPKPTARKGKPKTQEEIIMGFIKERYPSGVPLNCQTKYRSTFNEAEDLLKDAATISGNDYLDPKFRKKFARLKKKWLEVPHSPIPM